MPLDINGYNETFKAFVDFAQAKAAENNKKAVARGRLEDGALAGREVTASATDSVHKRGRTADDMAANDSTRDIFKSAIIDMFGGEGRKAPLRHRDALLGVVRRQGAQARLDNEDVRPRQGCGRKGAEEHFGQFLARQDRRGAVRVREGRDADGARNRRFGGDGPWDRRRGAFGRLRARSESRMPAARRRRSSRPPDGAELAEQR